MEKKSSTTIWGRYIVDRKKKKGDLKPKSGTSVTPGSGSGMVGDRVRKGSKHVEESDLAITDAELEGIRDVLRYIDAPTQMPKGKQEKIVKALSKNIDVEDIPNFGDYYKKYGDQAKREYKSKLKKMGMPDSAAESMTDARYKQWKKWHDARKKPKKQPKGTHSSTIRPLKLPDTKTSKLSKDEEAKERRFIENSKGRSTET